MNVDKIFGLQDHRLPANGQATKQRPVNGADGVLTVLFSPLQRALPGSPASLAPGGGGVANGSPLHERILNIHGLWVLLFALLLVATVASLGHYYDDPAYSKSRGWRHVAAQLDRPSRNFFGVKCIFAQRREFGVYTLHLCTLE